MDYANSYSSGYGSGDYSYTPSKPKATTSVADKKGYTPVSSTAKATTASAKKYQATYSSNDNYESPSSSSKGLGAPTTKTKTKVAAPTVQEKFASAYTSAGGTFNSYTARPDPISVYDSPDFKTVEDYLNKTAIEDALYDAQGIINQAYTPQMNVETRRMTEEEIKKFTPVKELTDKGVTVEELASMDAPMQKATLESLGITNAKWVSSQGMYPMSEEEFDKATMESVHYGRDTGVFDRIAPKESTDTGNGLMSSPRPKPRPEGSEPEVKAPAKGNTAFLEDYLDKVLVSEGLYQDDIEDTGNVVKKDGTILGTMRGITPKVYAKWVNKSVNDLTVEDMKSISEDTAREIYREEYWKKPKLDKLPENLQESVFDMYINAGGGAIRALQRAAGMPESEVDGSLGPKTLAAVEKAGLSANDYADARIAYYQEVVRKNPLKKKYLNGWIRRANKYRD